MASDDDDFLTDGAGDDGFFMAGDEDGGDGDAPADDGPGLPLPRLNSWLFGQAEAEKTLLSLYREDRLPHALILSGPPGIGKATLAFRLARFLLAEPERQQASSGLFGSPPPPASLELSAEHSVFRRVGSGGHADLLTIERVYDEKKGAYKSEIPVDTVREVTPFLRKTAAEGGWRIVIVDGAEALNLNGQNALLKILEEPPKKAVLILTTSQPGLFLPTVRSRCRSIPCRSLDEATVIKLLDIARPRLPADEKRALARLAGGSIGRAVSLAEQGGIALYQKLMEALAASSDWETIHKMAEQMGVPGADTSYRTTMDLLSGWLMRMARASARGTTPDFVVPGERAVVEGFAGRKSAQGWLEAWERVTHLTRQAEDFSLDRRQTVLEVFSACGEAR